MIETELFSSDAPARHRVLSVLTNKSFGDMHPFHDEKSLISRLGKLLTHIKALPNMILFRPRISHGCQIQLIQNVRPSGTFTRIPAQDEKKHTLKRTRIKCDSIITWMGEKPFGVFLAPADCMALVLYSKNQHEGQYLCVLHISLRTLIAGIIDETIEMTQTLGCIHKDTHAHLLAGIDTCCYGIDALEAHRLIQNKKELAAHLFKRDKDTTITTVQSGPRKNLPAVHLKDTIIHKLGSLGVENISAKGFECTSCSKTGFFSHVRGDTKRNGLIVMCEPISLRALKGTVQGFSKAS